MSDGFRIRTAKSKETVAKLIGYLITERGVRHVCGQDNGDIVGYFDNDTDYVHWHYVSSRETYIEENMKSSKLDKAIEASFQKLGSGIQFDIFDLSKLHNEVKQAVESGKELETAMQEAIAKYRKN